MTISRAVLVAVVLAAVGCKSSPNAPSPQYPNMTGIWTGTLNVVEGGSRNTCTHSWNITTQNGGTFSGSSQNAGDASACAPILRIGPGSVSGTVATDGVVSFGPIVRLESVCIRLSGGTYSGRVSGSSITATTVETIRCTDMFGTYEFTQSLAVTLAR
jgi:hypothetical protein